MSKRKSTDEAVQETSKMAKSNDENETISQLQNFVNKHVSLNCYFVYKFPLIMSFRN